MRFYLGMGLLMAALVLGAARRAKQEPMPTVPLVDQEALAAHADSAGIPRAAGYALAWKETRDGSCLPRCPRGPGQIVVDSITIDSVTGTVRNHTRRVCREVGRMQINPCVHHEKQNPRCAFKRVRDNVHDNYACGMWYYRTVRDRAVATREARQHTNRPVMLSDDRRALSGYNGGNPVYAEEALAKVGEWWMDGLLHPTDN